MYSDSSDQMTVVEKIRKYSSFYEKKYGISPDLCHLHPSLFDGIEKEERDNLGVELVADDLILRNNFWIGVEKGTFQFYSDLKLKELEE